MKKTTNLLLIILAFLLICSFAFGQSLTVIRTDVTANRSGFVTATYTFGIDIIADGVTNCNGVTFELSYDNYDYVKYSQWQHGDFGRKTTTAVISEEDNPLHQGKIYVGATSGEDINNASIDNPKVIHIDFVVTPEAPNGGKVILSFTNAMAVINDSATGGKIINLQSQPVVFDIHGFVDVYPGDTDNNKIVDNRDFAYIDLYMGYGTEAIPVRSFKRENASTLWEAQKCLLWDDGLATYADCDGNGEVTVTDVLVWKYNFLKIHTLIGKKDDHAQSVDLMNNYFSKTENSISIPVYINTENGFLGVSGKLKLENNSSYKIIGIEKGDLLTNKPAFVFTKVGVNKSEIEFAIGSLDNEFQLRKNGVIAYLVIEPLKKDNEFYATVKIENLIGISYNGILFQIESSANEVKENSKILNLSEYSIDGNLLSIFPEKLKNVDIEPSVFDMLGNQLNCNYLLDNGKITIDISALNHGIYFIVLNCNNSLKLLKFTK